MTTLFAYVDAGSGSLLLQALMGGFAGVVVFSRIAWQSLLPRLGLRSNSEASAS